MKWKLIGNILGAFFLIGVLIFSAYMLVPFVKYLSVPVAGSAPAPTFKESPEVAKQKAENKQNYFNTKVFGDTSNIVHNINQVPEQGGWLNTAPLDLHALAAEDKLILVYFWSYSCSECYRNSAYIESLWQRYRDHGLVVVGIHSPVFDFEKNPKNILKALQASDITYPVMTDGDKKVWNKFGNHFLPASYLINPRGDVVYRQFNEGGYAQEEAAIREQLNLYGWDLPSYKNPPVFLTQDDKIIQTPTLYAGAGFIRRELGNPEQPYLKKTNVYSLPKKILDDRIYLGGSWKAATDYLEAVTAAQVQVSYQANSVYIVLGQASAPVMVEVQLDGAPVPEAMRGKDIIVNADKTYMQITEPRLYFPIKDTAPFGRHLLTLVTPPGLRLYTFTFGVYNENR